MACSLLSEMLHCNSWFTLQTYKAFLPAMIAANHGHLVSIASCAGLCGGNQLSGSVLMLILNEVIHLILNSAINIHGRKRKPKWFWTSGSFYTVKASCETLKSWPETDHSFTEHFPEAQQCCETGFSAKAEGSRSHLELWKLRTSMLLKFTCRFLIGKRPL